jgi:hypothetical protein
MAKEKKEVKVKEPAVEEKPRWYKGYDIKWLRKEVDHSDYPFVKEYDELYGDK